MIYLVKKVESVRKKGKMDIGVNSYQIITGSNDKRMWGGGK